MLWAGSIFYTNTVFFRRLWHTRFGGVKVWLVDASIGGSDQATVQIRIAADSNTPAKTLYSVT